MRKLAVVLAVLALVAAAVAARAPSAAGRTLLQDASAELRTNSNDGEQSNGNSKPVKLGPPNPGVVLGKVMATFVNGFNRATKNLPNAKDINFSVDNKGNLFNSDGQLVHTSGKKDHSSGTTGGASNRNSQQADGTAGSNSKLDGHGDGQGSDPGAGAGAGAGGGGAKTTVPFSTEPTIEIKPKFTSQLTVAPRAIAAADILQYATSFTPEASGSLVPRLNVAAAAKAKEATTATLEAETTTVDVVANTAPAPAGSG